MSKSKYLYHGSSKELEVLEPRPSKVIEGEKAVFATNERALAIAFIPKWNDCDFSLGYHGGKLLMMEMYPGAFGVLKDGKGYLYQVSAEPFVSDKRLGMQKHEFIHKGDVKPLKKENIDNVFEALKNEKINLVSFEQCMNALWDAKLLTK